MQVECQTGRRSRTHPSVRLHQWPFQVPNMEVSNLYGYESIPINTIFRGMNIHLPAIFMFTRVQGFDPLPYVIHGMAYLEHITQSWPCKLHLKHELSGSMLKLHPNIQGAANPNIQIKVLGDHFPFELVDKNGAKWHSNRRLARNGGDPISNSCETILQEYQHSQRIGSFPHGG